MSKRVSVVIPCRNEEAHIERCLDSLLKSNIDHSELEIVVVDGNSTDRTCELLRPYELEYPDVVRRIDNPDRITPIAMNLGIKAASGEVIMIVGMHAVYDPEFVPSTVRALAENDADAIGGIWRMVPAEDTLMGNALKLALEHPFCSGNVLFRTGSDQVRKVDTVGYAGFKRSVFDRIGYINPKLVRGQDREFSHRLAYHGGTILLDPSIASPVYKVRSRFWKYLKWWSSGGFWVFIGRRHTTTPILRIRNYIPIGFVLYCLLVLLGGLWFPRPIEYLLVLPLVIYGLVDLVVSAQIAIKARNPIVFPLLLFIFPAGHFGYGIGSLCGWIGAAIAGKDLPPAELVTGS